MPKPNGMFNISTFKTDGIAVSSISIGCLQHLYFIF